MAESRAKKRGIPSVLLRLVAALVPLVVLGAAAAQAPSGATLTVVSGQIAVVKSNGSAFQPAPTGMTLGVGDQVATVGRSVALVTFFEGSEMELGSETTIIVRDVRSVGGEVHITIEDVLGATVSRVKAFANPNSIYTIQNSSGQVVALVRGSTVGYTSFETGGTLVKADCTRVCSVLFEQEKVCEGNFFACGVDAKGGVTNDASYDGGLIDRDDRDRGGGGEDGGGTLGR